MSDLTAIINQLANMSRGQLYKALGEAQRQHGQDSPQAQLVHRTILAKMGREPVDPGKAREGPKRRVKCNHNN